MSRKFEHLKTTIIIGDSRRMNELIDECVHLIITSPPYWQLKDYGNGSQIGFNDSYEEYINNLNLVWNECYRVLHKGCRLCVNIGDQIKGIGYKMSEKTAESQGIDGYLGDIPVSIKPDTYKLKKSLREEIPAKVIFYKKIKNGIEVDYSKLFV